MSKNLIATMLRTVFPGKPGVLALVVIGLAYQSPAVPVTVQEGGMGPNEVVELTSSTLGTVWAYAGTIDIIVNGKPTDGYCIDPFHWGIAAPEPYNTEALGNGPKPPAGPMGAATALKIEQLWQQYYAHDMSNANAAGLQIAIWELVGGQNFHLDSGNDYGAGSMLDWVNTHSDAPAANLIALTGPGQDYVVPNLPDGGQTALLLSLAIAGLFVARSKVLKPTPSR